MLQIVFVSDCHVVFGCYCFKVYMYTVLTFLNDGRNQLIPSFLSCFVLLMFFILYGNAKRGADQAWVAIASKIPSAELGFSDGDVFSAAQADVVASSESAPGSSQIPHV